METKGFRLYDSGLSFTLEFSVRFGSDFLSISALFMLCFSIFYDGFSLLYIVFGSILDNKKGDILGD